MERIEGMEGVEAYTLSESEVQRALQAEKIREGSKKKYKILDVIEAIMLFFVAFSLSRNAFSQAGVIPCIIFSVAICVIFMIFYHERYIGIVLNFLTSILWTVIICLGLSFISIFEESLILLIVAGVVILFLSMCIHGVSPHQLNRDPDTGEHLIRVKNKKVQEDLTELNNAYTTYTEMKEQVQGKIDFIATINHNNEARVEKITKDKEIIEQAEREYYQVLEKTKARKIPKSYIPKLRDCKLDILAAVEKLKYYENA